MDEYVRRFVWRLNREFADDKTCRRIAADKKFGPGCARLLRTYVDPEFRSKQDAERRTKMEARRAELVKAIDGLEAAANLCRHRDPERAAAYHIDAAAFQAELAGVDELLDLKRHGRFRDHGILYSARQVMERALGPVTYDTLANLITAAQLALGQEDAPPVDAQSLRMALSNFTERNQNWDPTANSSS
jgi:hypothetical protein